MSQRAATTDTMWNILPARVVHRLAETPRVWTYDIEVDFDRLNPLPSALNNERSRPSSLPFRPGQFNMLYMPGVGEVAISISGHDTRSSVLKHTIRSVGNVTAAIESGGVGLSLGLRGPFGTAWPLGEVFSTLPETKDVIVVGGGIGLAPLRSLIECLIQRRNDVGRIAVLVGARRPEELLYGHAFSDWRSADVSVQTTVDQPDADWEGHVGVVTLLLERLEIPRPSSTLVMTCGPEAMMRYVAKSAIDRKIPCENIWITMERNMNCAIGLCGHCQFGPHFICKDGPVFRYADVRELLRVQGL